MRIAYSCAGEGLGHAVRTSVIGPQLEKRHTVVYFTPETIRAFLSTKMGTRKFEDIPNFSFVKRDEKVLILATIIRSLPTAARMSYNIVLFAKKLRSLKIDAVISDFDPILPRAARMAGIPVFQLNHPGIVQRVARFHPFAWLTSIASRILEGPWHERIHISFYQGDVGPILRPEIFRYPVTDERFVLLNLKACYRPAMLPILEKASKAYRLFPNTKDDFEKALSACSCVISSAGHQIIAESLALNKPILVIPQRGQWEQRLNAEMITETGKGMSTGMKRLEQDLPLFMGKLDEFRAKILSSRFDVSDNSAMIVGRIESFLTRFCRPQRVLAIGIAVKARPVRGGTLSSRHAAG